MSELERLQRRLAQLEREVGRDRDHDENMAAPGQFQGTCQQAPAQRPPARHYLAMHIEGLESQVRQLRGLLGQLPTELSPEADEALFDLLTRPR